VRAPQGHESWLPLFWIGLAIIVLIVVGKVWF